MSVNKSQNSRTVVEPVALGSQTLSDSELSSLTLAHSTDQFGSSDYEAYASLEAELESMQAEEVITSEDHTIIEESGVEIEPETIIPDVEMTDVSDEPQQFEQIIYTTAAPSVNQNLILQTKPTLQKVPATTAAQVCSIHLQNI